MLADDGEGRQLAFALLEEADAADVKALKQSAEKILVNQLQR